MTSPIKTLTVGIPAALAEGHWPNLMSLVAAGAALADRVLMGIETDPVGWTASARNRILARARKREQDALLFIDSDMIFTPADVGAILDHLDDGCDVVGAFYPRKILDYQALAEYLQDGDRAGAGTYQDRSPSALKKILQRSTWLHDEEGPVVQVRNTSRVEVDWLPTGFLGLRLSAMKKVEEFLGESARYTDTDRSMLGHVTGNDLECVEVFSHPLMWITNDKGESKKRLMGEDTSSTIMMRHAGIKLWKIRELELGHIGRWVF